MHPAPLVARSTPATARPRVPSATQGTTTSDKTSYLLYGPKTASGWGMPINLQGPQGNANVKVDTFTLMNSDWIWNSVYNFSTPGVAGGVFTRYHDRGFTSVTQDVLDKGEVMVFFTPNNSNPNQVVALALFV
ncbi:hypothetical protein ACQ86N_15925 [Puia sp. P3]|uniref:hypothetical protein n=1 Tax=Puia sp. P3 TaxID=3423952 RepID=UPI003D66C828